MTSGRPMTAVRAATFSVSEVRHTPGDLYASHAHELPYFLLVLRGAFREEVRGRAVELTSGDVVIMPAGCVHRDSIDRVGLEALLVTLDAAPSRFSPAWRCLSGGPVSRALISLYASSAGGELFAAEESFHEAMSAAGGEEPSARPDRRVVRVVLDVLHASSEQPLRFADVATQAGVDPAYLARAFKRCTGVTMGSYLRTLRARRAASMLASTADALAGVAAAAGFADQSHLCRVFRAEYGVTPARYRRLMQRSSSFNT